MHNIVILGGNFAGVSTAHYLLRHVLPSLNSTSSGPGYRVTLVSPSDHTFYNMSAPRALISPEVLPANKVFASIPDAFSLYKSSEFSFIQGEATGVNEATKSVSVSLPGDNMNTSLQYDSLVIATGTTSTSPLWRMHGDHGHTAAAFEDLQRRLPQATTILIVGGGPAGVETAGEISSHYKLKDITILTGAARLLTNLRHTGVAQAAERQLHSLNVKTIYNVKVASSRMLSDGRTSVTLSDGSTKTVDIYIDCTGGAPNTRFVPANWMDEKNRVVADEKTLRATKAPAGVYSIGDVASYSKGNIMDALWAVPALGYSIWSDLQDVKGGVMLKEKKYKQIEADMQFVPIGPQGGVGVIFGWKVPSFFVWLAKSKTMLVEKAPGLATGAQFLKA